MNKPAINAKIIRTEPGTDYGGRTYDQAVFIEISGGVILDIFDYEMIATSEMINNTKNITILVFLAKIDKSCGPKFGVEPAADENRMVGNGHIFHGRVVKKDDVYHKFIVDVGIGEILVSLNDTQFNEFNIGDFLRIFSVRADLDSIQDIK